MLWKEIVKNALEHLGGQAPLKDIYDYIKRDNYDSLSATWLATIRGTLERASSDSASFENREDLFYSVDGLGAGIWGLRSFVPTEENMDITQDDSSFSEGRILLKKHILRERNHQVITKAKKKYLETHG